MNKTDIIETAFQVWGRELFKTTSLSQIAQALGVTKPALYRHFESRGALLDGMYGYYCDHYVGFMKASYEKAVESRDINQGILLMARNFAEYYARHKYIFIFSLIEVYGDKNRDKDILRQFAIRGMDVKKHWFFLEAGDDHPSKAQLIVTAIFFLVTLFHKSRHGKTGEPTNEEIQQFISFAEGVISHGLGFDKNLVNALDFEKLEKSGGHQIPPEGENEGLLKAVAGAVAEAGPWNASMDMVAQRSGLSKSGLYAHFKSKADMLGQMFIAEFDRIVDYAELEQSRSELPEEQFYLAIAAIANYLRSRPEILITLDWIRTRRLDLGVTVPPRIYRIFADIKLEGAGENPGGLALSGETLSQWILFLVVNTLMRRPERFSFSDVSNTSFQILYKFIVLGIEGW
ncbi:TetR/AcrR family transcriptional regulator [Treponema primitia]|uniref:TetR/AcrR family transcriptional regulator n=1 Tax=Treponema primitia TaxID=88058 RepID=UPI00025555CB|nr:TetR/AcrR family transcriptional regulator [Treponema primitia]